MGTYRVTIYGFVCDHPSGCQTAYEATPFEHAFWGAVREIQRVGWQVRVLRRGRTYYCPEHREDRSGGTNRDPQQAGVEPAVPPTEARDTAVAGQDTGVEREAPAAAGAGTAG